MGAVYGILGDADVGEIRAIGDRLVHRRDSGSGGSLGPMLRVGMPTRRGWAQRLARRPIVFNGTIDTVDDALLESSPRITSPSRL